MLSISAARLRACQARTSCPPFSVLDLRGIDMINDAVDYLRREVVEYLGVPTGEVFAGPIHALREDTNNRGLYLSVVDLALETTLRNTPHALRQNNSVRYQEPPVFLNVYLLFAADYAVYDTSLLRLSQTIERFQSKPRYDAASASLTNPFPASLEKLILDFCTLTFEQLNDLWGILGGSHLPSVLYKVRMVQVQRDVTTAGPEITTIRVESALR